MAQLNPYLKFEGNCKEAMNFYHECLGGELEIQTIGESPMAAHMPPESHDKILHSSLSKDGAPVLFGSDKVTDEGVKQGNSVALCLHGSLDEVRTAFDKLAEGGEVAHPLKEEFFGTFGDLVDKYGKVWMVEADKSPAA